jgi:hypothetical protein
MVFRRREPLHVRLAREGGLTPKQEPHNPGPHWGEVGIHGMHRQRQWDAVVTTEADVAGEVVQFVALADGMLLVEEGDDEADPTSFADALEGSIEAPYRAQAVNRQGVWAVAAQAIEVVELAPDPGGNELEVAWNGRELSFRVDGALTFGSAPVLERLASARHEQWVVRASRLDGRLWELSVAPL